MLLNQNAVNSLEVNLCQVNGGNSVSSAITAENYVFFNAKFENLFGFVYYVVSEISTDSTESLIRNVFITTEEDTSIFITKSLNKNILITPEEDVNVLINDRSSSRECIVDVNMFTDVGLVWDNYVKTTFYPLYAINDLSCSVVIKRPITPETITDTSSMVNEGVLKQWSYYISNTSDTSYCGTVGVVTEVVLDNQVSMRALGSLSTDNNSIRILNTSEMDGGQGLIFIDGYLKLDLNSNECCVYPEAQTEEDINCNGN